MLLIPTRTGAPDATAMAACEFGPFATRRKRVAFVCRCIPRTLTTVTHKRVLNMLELGRAFADKTAGRPELEAAVREVDRIAAEAAELARADIWTLFEGRRAGEAATVAHAARTASAAMRWALGTGGTPPSVPASWAWAKQALADSATAPVCDPAWRTPDVLALARLVQSGGTDALPILADALQDAGCEDERILGHCRDGAPHCPACWVPDLLLDAEASEVV